MSAAAVAAWLAELVRLLGDTGISDAVDEDALDALLRSGLSLDLGALGSDVEGLDPAVFGSALAMLAAARAQTAAELTAVHRQRIDVDRTVRAITAYVRALG